MIAALFVERNAALARVAALEGELRETQALEWSHEGACVRLKRERDRYRQEAQAEEWAHDATQDALASARQEAWRLREALVDASDMCRQELNIDNRAGIERVLRNLSLALSPSAPENKETP